MRFIFVLLMTGLFGCHGSQGDKNNGSVDPSPVEMEKASADVCPEGQSLYVADPNSYVVGTTRKALLVASGDGACASISDVHDEWIGNGSRQFFYLSLPATGGCIPNNSVWEYSGGTFDSWEAHFHYTNMTGDRILSIHSSYEIGATYLRDHAGLRVLDCK